VDIAAAFYRDRRYLGATAAEVFSCPFLMELSREQLHTFSGRFFLNRLRPPFERLILYLQVRQREFF
jgi:hypothetical protein